MPAPETIVATLIGHKGRALTQADCDAAGRLYAFSRHDWLATGEACDLFGNGEAAAIRAILEPWAQQQNLDVIVQPVEGRRKQALLADMESTIIHQEMLDELAAYIGKSEEVKEITRRSMNGELDFRMALQERLALLKGISATVIADLKKIITPMEGAAELVTTMRANGHECILVSGGFTCFIEPVATTLGFSSYHGNILDVANNQLTGEMVEPVLDKTSKRQILAKTASRLGLAEDAIIAVGDGANDIPMLQAAGLGIAFHGKPNVQKAALHNVRFASLRALLWAQGYKK